MGQEQEKLYPLLLISSIFFLTVNSLFLTLPASAVWIPWLVSTLLLGYGMQAAFKGASIYPAGTFATGLWCIITVVCAHVLGLYLSSSYLQHYRSINNGESLEAVDPSSLEGRGLAGASLFAFENGSFVDDYRTTGFVARGRMYCVAPVARRGRPSSEVYFWAVGIDCCERRSNFDCGTSRDDGELMAAISYSTSADKYFREAIAASGSVHGTSSPPEAELVAFVADPDAVKDRIWGRALTLMVAATAMHLGCSMIVLLVAKSVGPRQPDPMPKAVATTNWIRDGCQEGKLDPSALEWDSIFGMPRYQICSGNFQTELLNIETWEKRHMMGKDDLRFFDEVFIAEDGGLRHEVKDLVRKVNLSTYIFALVTPTCILYNTIYIVNTDLFYIRSGEKVDVDWCVIGYLVDNIAQSVMVFFGSQGTPHVPARIVVAVLEILFLGMQYLKLVFLTIEALLTPDVRRRWANVSQVFFDTLPSLCSFSAMQLLRNAVPSVARFDLLPKLNEVFELEAEAIREHVLFDGKYIWACVDLAAWVMLRLLAAMAGLDAFLVKFRFASEYVTADHLTMSNLCGSLGFVMQLVGIIDLGMWNRRRIQDFLFAKADGELSELDAADKEVWNCMLTERVWRYSKDSVFTFSVVMLTFTDVDFQRLVLNEKGRDSEGGDDGPVA